jgi:hypothetical protein
MRSVNRKSENPIMPLFCFLRQPDIEAEHGLLLAGRLVVDFPKNKKLKKKHQRLILDTLQHLAEEVYGGKKGKMVFGWRSGDDPAKRADPDDKETIFAWVDRSLVFDVRVEEGKITFQPTLH